MIRPAHAGDLPAITRIYNQSVEERASTADTQARSLEERALWFAQFDDRYPIWVYEEKGQVLGYACLFKYSPKDGYRFATEHSVYIAREARGRGFGRLLLGDVLKQAESLGFEYILARIFSHNAASIRLHESAGFALLGRQKRIVQMDGNWYDVTLMDRRLG